MPESNNISSDKTKSRYEQIFAERNRALRLLFDTTISIVNDGVLPPLVAQKLLEISNGEYCSFAFYNKKSKELELKVFVDIEGVINLNDTYRVPVSKENYDKLCEKQIDHIRDDDDTEYLKKLFPAEYQDEKKDLYYIPCVSDKRLIGVCVIQLPEKIKLKLKDIIEILMNICGIEAQRKINYEELLISEQQLLHSEEEIRRLFETCGVPMCAIDLDCNIIKCNRHFLAMWKITPEQSKTMKCYEICEGEACQTKDCFLKTIKSNERIEKEVYKKDPNGKEYILNVVATPLIENGKIVGAIEAMHDITDQIKMKQDIEKSNEELLLKTNELEATQKKLVESTNLSALSTLSTGIAHEFNNILTIMSGYIEILNSSLEDESYKNIINTMNNVTDRAKQITEGLLEFSQHLSTQNKLSADIRTVLDNAIMLNNNTLINSKIIVEKNYKDIPATFCFSSQLTQVFLNILNNAVEAMTDTPQKKLTLNIKYCEHTTCVEKGLSCKSPDGCIQIEITDTGIGIEKDDMDKIFEPFYTTKGVLGKGNISKSGTGLGLSISYGIIKRHTGTINVSSKKDEGTTVTISLPVDRKGYSVAVTD